MCDKQLPYLSGTVFYFEKTQLYEVSIIRTKKTNLLCYRFHDTVVELGISVITFELVQAIHVSQNVMHSKDCI